MDIGTSQENTEKSADDIIAAVNDRIATFHGSEEHLLYKEFAQHISAKLLKAENVIKYIQLAEEWRLFYNQVYVVGVCHWVF